MLAQQPHRAGPMFAMLLPRHDPHHSQDHNRVPAQNDSQDHDDGGAQDYYAEQRDHDGAREFPVPDVDVHGEVAEYSRLSHAV